MSYAVVYAYTYISRTTKCNRCIDYYCKVCTYMYM